jgi:hypothetical protein
MMSDCEGFALVDCNRPDRLHLHPLGLFSLSFFSSEQSKQAEKFLCSFSLLLSLAALRLRENWRFAKLLAVKARSNSDFSSFPLLFTKLVAVKAWSNSDFIAFPCLLSAFLFSAAAAVDF